jgi:hypothetical protein
LDWLLDNVLLHQIKNFVLVEDPKPLTLWFDLARLYRMQSKVGLQAETFLK